MAVSNEVDREGESEWSDFADLNSDRNCDTFKKESSTNYASGLFEECYKKITSCFPGNRKTPPKNDKTDNVDKQLDISNLRVTCPHNSLFEKSSLDSIIRYNQRHLDFVFMLFFFNLAACSRLYAVNEQYINFC